jgi:hypothetical protein
MCYERRRAEAGVDWSAHHALVNAAAGEREIVRKKERECACIYCRTYYKAVRVGREGLWRTRATRDDEPRPVWTSLSIKHWFLVVVVYYCST